MDMRAAASRSAGGNMVALFDRSRALLCLIDKPRRRSPGVFRLAGRGRLDAALAKFRLRIVLPSDLV
jgi:hypothetical protein